jgi:hypothetical protein
MKNKLSFLKALALLSATGFLGAISNSAIAEDGKAIPGTNCVDQSNQNDVSYATFNGYLANDVNGYNRVQCPVVRDTMAARSNHFNFVRVQLQKFKTTSTTCFLDSRSRAGNTGSFRSGSASGTGYRTVNIAQPIQSFYYGAMNISCGLQDDDRLHGYNYSEK